ncbi:MAG: class II aldolase/adducin family protein [Lachnospiraceae bacterium]|nr:class II aldolase/adducin family protein [Lachnospiraceae bacterium]
MDLYKAKKDLVETGRELLKRKLTARTWGNISERVDGTHFLITPSGLDYMKTSEEDIVLYNISDGTYEGNRKPSSEKG